MYDSKYHCKVCGRKWRALDDDEEIQTCVCGEEVRPFESEQYNLSQLRYWSFWDQVEDYKMPDGF